MIVDKIYNYFERNENLHVLFVFDPLGMTGEELSEVQWRDGYLQHHVQRDCRSPA